MITNGSSASEATCTGGVASRFSGPEGACRPPAFSGGGTPGWLKGALHVAGDVTGINDAIACVEHPSLGSCISATIKLGLDALAIASLGGTSELNVGLTAAETGGIDVMQLGRTATVARHAEEVTKAGESARPYINSPLTIRSIIEAGDPVPDPGGVPGGLRWDVPGGFRGSPGTWELVIDQPSNTILHFLFRGTP